MGFVACCGYHSAMLVSDFRFEAPTHSPANFVRTEGEITRAPSCLGEGDAKTNSFVHPCHTWAMLERSWLPWPCDSVIVCFLL